MPIDFSVENHIATVVFNRPERLNAFDAAHYAELGRVFSEVRDDPKIRVAVLTGAGEKSFSSGGDLKAPMPRLDEITEVMLTQKELLPQRGMEIWKPLIAAVNGYCLGGGLCLLLATDIRIAAEHATFALAEVRRGGIPGNGGTQRIMQQLPYPIAMEMLLTGSSVDAKTAAHWGLVNKVVPLAKLMPTALEYAQKIADGAPLAVQAAKEMAIRSRELDTATGLRIERIMQNLLHTSYDWKEGCAAFAEKRPAKFLGK